MIRAPYKGDMRWRTIDVRFRSLTLLPLLAPDSESSARIRLLSAYRALRKVVIFHDPRRWIAQQGIPIISMSNIVAFSHQNKSCQGSVLIIQMCRFFYRYWKTTVQMHTSFKIEFASLHGVVSARPYTWHFCPAPHLVQMLNKISGSIYVRYGYLGVAWIKIDEWANQDPKQHRSNDVASKPPAWWRSMLSLNTCSKLFLIQSSLL